MRNDLDRRAEIIAAALLLEDRLVDSARRRVVGLASRDAGEAFIVAEIEVGLGAVIGNEDLAVLGRRHRAGIDVQIGVEFAQPDAVAARLQQGAERCRGNALPEGGHNASRDEDETLHDGCSV